MPKIKPSSDWGVEEYKRLVGKTAASILIFESEKRKWKHKKRLPFSVKMFVEKLPKPSTNFLNRCSYDAYIM